jgi:hypothetical protein
MIWTLYKGTNPFLKRGVTYSFYSFGEYLLLLLLISWGCTQSFVLFCFVLKELLWFAHHKFFWNIGFNKGLKPTPSWKCNWGVFLILKRFPRPRAGGFSIKKKPKPNKSSKNQELANTRYYEHTIISQHSSLFHMTHIIYLWRKVVCWCCLPRQRMQGYLCLDSL